MGVQRPAATRTSRRTGHSIQYSSHACIGAAHDGALSPTLRSCARRSGGICFCQPADFLQHGLWQQIMYFSPRLWLLQGPTRSFTRAGILEVAGWKYSITPAHFALPCTIYCRAMSAGSGSV